jgi:hypothetical protein
LQAWSLPDNPLGPRAKQNASSIAEIFGEPAHLKADIHPFAIKAFSFSLFDAASLSTCAFQSTSPSPSAVRDRFRGFDPIALTSFRCHQQLKTKLLPARYPNKRTDSIRKCKLNVAFFWSCLGGCAPRHRIASHRIASHCIASTPSGPVSRQALADDLYAR